MIDHCQRQRDIIARERLQFVGENVSQEAFVMGVNRRAWPIGARYFFALQQVWAPRSAVMPKEAAE
ncbi:putative predicted protein [Rhizobium favelukesii]|uniref:Uncharacterized protein n=1 Tax=Rhizobium favelukesii TaxID=348824 RepID=W6RG32_9HYPH|nr:hypothetical protein [Rhizobium favelukesii]CDM57658.1 putative predicted protein [Rhizobium favelukesii]